MGICTTYNAMGDNVSYYSNNESIRKEAALSSF